MRRAPWPPVCVPPRTWFPRSSLLIPALRWQYGAHEQILPAIRRLGGTVHWTDIVIEHTGYEDAALRPRKLASNLRLLHLEDTEHPDDPFTLFNLGWTYQELGQTAEALPLLQRSVERSP